MRIVKTALLVLPALAITIFAVRIFLLDRITTLALQKIGTETVSVHFSDIGFNRADIETLAATFTLPTGEQLLVALKDVSLQYNLRQLLTTGKCNRVVIQVMEISRTATPRHQSSQLSLPEKITLLSDDLRSRLPLQELRIEQLLLHGDLPPQFTEKKIQLNTAITGTTITAAVTLQLTRDTLITVDLQSTDSVQGSAEIIGLQGQNQILQAAFTLKPDTVSGTVDLQLRPLRDLALQAMGTTDVPEIDGRMRGTFTLPVPIHIGSNVEAEFTLSDTINQQLHLKANGNPIAKNGSLILSGQRKEQEFLNIKLTIGDQRIRGHYLVDAGSLRSFLKPYLQRPLPDITGQLEGTLDLPLSDSKDRSFTVIALATATALPAFSSSSARIQLTGNMTGKAILLDRSSKIHAQNIILGNTEINELDLDLAGNFKKLEDQFLLDFADRQNIRIKGLTTGRLHIDDLHLHPENPLQAAVHKSSWSVAGNTINLTPLRISEGARSYITGPLTLRLSTLDNSGSGIVLSSKIETSSLIYQDNTLKLPLKDLSGTVQLNDDTLTAELQVSHATIAGRVKGNIKHDFAAAAGSFSLETSQRFDLDQEEVGLADLFSPWQLPFDLDKGKVSLNGNGSWAPRKKMQLTAFAAVTGGSGFYKQFLFKGLALRQDLALLPGLYSKTEGSVSLDQLIGGIDVHDIHAGLTFVQSKTGPRPQVRLNDISASLFGGSISSPAVVYDVNQPESRFTVDVKDLEMASLVKLINMESLHVTGRISGTIPVTLAGKDISVDNGELHNEPPGGEIRYTPANMNSAGLTGYALKAVQDFRYDSLKVTAQYLPSGQLDLDIGLRGNSPGLDTSRPVHLNIHAEQNLPALMQSLRFSKGLTEKLDKRIKQHYK